jgi:cellulose synthase/poly-beta-1,6-N-acetylglucosamine synthase-like glycosyltransferase
MNWSTWIRQSHRWLSVAFTATVIISIVAVSQENPAVWVFYLPLFPLALQMFTGLFLFALPYAAKRRARRRAA